MNYLMHKKKGTKYLAPFFCLNPQIPGLIKICYFLVQELLSGL